MERFLGRVFVVLSSLAVGLGGSGSVGAQEATGGGVSYRFQEQPVLSAGPGDTAGQYRVGFRERLTTAIDSQRAAPKTSELSIQAIYQERPAELDPADPRRVSAVVRKYATVRLEPDPAARPGGAPLFEGLEVYCRQRPGEVPPLQVLVLTPGRTLQDREFDFATKQIFVPELALALPREPLKIGDSFKPDPAGAGAILGGLVIQAELTGTLKEVKVDIKTGLTIATFEIVGRGETDLGIASARAAVDFAFPPGEAGADGVVVVDGHVIRLRLAEEITSVPPPESGQRMRQYLRRELTLERRLEDPGAALTVPVPAPVSTVENSWLTYQDPAGRFHFRHPQDLLRSGVPQSGSDEVELTRLRADGRDSLIVSLRPDTELQADAVLEAIHQEWLGISLIATNEAQTPLPEADWPGQKITRLEATLRPALQEGGPGVQFYGYVVRTGRTAGLYLEAMTDRVAPEAFRSEVESIMRSFQFDREPAASPAAAELPTAGGVPSGR